MTRLLALALLLSACAGQAASPPPPPPRSPPPPPDAPAAAAAQPAVNLVAATPDAALDAFLQNRYVAVGARGATEAGLRAAVARGVAGGQIRGGASRADAPDTSRAGLGVVSFSSASDALATVRKSCVGARVDPPAARATRR
jgi:hypothetical protein